MVASGRRSGNLWLELSSFVGRRAEVSSAAQLVSDARLLTLTGVGGVGKSRVALQTAAEMRAAFEDGVWLVDLSPLCDSAQVAPAVTSVLGLREQSGSPPELALAKYLAPRRLLLLLDNCEHLLEGCAALVDTVLRRCPGLHILVTSREPLRVDGETVLPVPPLFVPDPDAGASSQEALKADAAVLFAERAAAVVPTFSLGPDNQDAVLQICRRLDGLPLAIELAAIRLRALSLDQIAERLHQRFRLLTSGPRGAAPRHQTLRACVERSYELCSPAERLLWARLSVFRAGFELDAVEGICGDDELPPEDLLDVVANLVDRSILIRQPQGAVVRYRLLDTIREFGRDKLEEGGGEAWLRVRHREWFAGLVRLAAEDWVSSRQPGWFARLHRERANFQAALDYCIREPDAAERALRMAVDAWRFYWWDRSCAREGRLWLARALAVSGVPSTDRARAKLVDGTLAAIDGDPQATAARLKEARAMARPSADPALLAHCGQLAGLSQLQRGEVPSAIATIRQALDTLPEGEDLTLRLDLLLLLGVVAALSGDDGLASACHREVLGLTEPVGETFHRSYSFWALGLCALRSGDLDRATALIRQSLELRSGLDDLTGTAYCLESLAWVSGAGGRHEHATLLLGAADRLWQVLGRPLEPFQPLAAYHDECARCAREALGSDAFEAALRRGGSLQDPVAYALRDAPQVRGVRPPSDRIVSRLELFRRLSGAGRVTQLSAPGGSGKTTLVRSWIREATLEERAAWVSLQRGDDWDPQRFWIAVIDAIRETAAGSAQVRAVTAAPGLDIWSAVERLLSDLGSLSDQLWLVIDDLDELRSAEALRQLELFVMRAPPALRFVLVARHDLRLRLHRLRLEGELTEIRAGDLRFSVEAARTLLETAGVELSDSALALLLERTEGWAAGLQLAALALAHHPDQEGFAAEFSGSERTVADYLLAEVLDRQPEKVRRLLLRTSVLDRVTGPLADALTGDQDGETILRELEDANAFVVSLDNERSWFRYHRLFADLLQLELRRVAPREVPTLHDTAARWYAEHGYPVEAIRHARAAGNWEMAAHLLSDNWLRLSLTGRGDLAQEILAGFPSDAGAADLGNAARGRRAAGAGWAAELAALRAAHELAGGSLEVAERQLAAAAAGLESTPLERRGHLKVLVACLKLTLSRQRGDVEAAVEDAHHLLAPMAGPEAALPAVSDDLRAWALINLGTAELWALRLNEAEGHLEQGVVLARSIDQAFIEVTGLAYLAQLAVLNAQALATERSMQAIELAARHGWSNHRIAAVACVALGATLVWQGRYEEAESWLARAEPALPAEVEPASGILLLLSRRALALARGLDEDALEALGPTERLGQLLIPGHPLAIRARAQMLHTLLRLGRLDRVERTLAGLDEQERQSAGMLTALAALRLIKGDARGAAAAVEPIVGGAHETAGTVWTIRALVLDAIAKDTLGDADGAWRAIERALDLAEPGGVLFTFLEDPVEDLLVRHTRRPTLHASLVSQILNLRARKGLLDTAPDGPQRLREPLSESEVRVLRYLPTNLSAPEIAHEVYLSVNTVKTHMRNVYAKLDAHRRAEAVERARALGLLAPVAFRAEERTR